MDRLSHRGHILSNLSTIFRRITFNKIFQLFFCISNYSRFNYTFHFTICIKKATKLVHIFLFFMIVSVFLNGCSFKDIDKRAFVTSIGIDESESFEKKYKVTLKISLSKGGPTTTGSDFTVLSYDANSISEALTHMKSMTDKELFYGQTSTILIGEKIAINDIRPILNYFLKRPDIQRTSYLSVAVPTANHVLQYKPKIEQVAGSYLFSIFEDSSTDSPYVEALTLFDAHRRETEDGINIAMPIIEVEDTTIQVDKMALFSKTGMESKLNPKESELYRLLTKGVRNGSTQIETKDGAFTIKITKGNGRLKINRGSDNMLSVIFNIKLRATVEEKIDNQVSLSHHQIKNLQVETEKKMKKEINSLLDKIQKTQIDPIGIGLKFNASNFDHKDLDDFYSNLNVKVNVKCRIVDAGIVE
ncbi:Ger(x)C family spore germination protein [Cytobacillus kochii]